MKLVPVALLFAAATLPAATLPLMPMPANVTLGEGRLTIDSGFHIADAGRGDARLEAAAGRMEDRIRREFGFSALTPRHTVLTVQAGAANGDEESYTLDVTANAARLQAATAIGALRGLETFWQLIQSGPDGIYAPAVHIEDRPRYSWRGFMLDVSRHWMGVEVVERNLDAMAAVKLNVFHWHLSDDQGVRVESKRFPKLQELASDGHFYTQSEIRSVIAYAAARGIRVVPEFDIPGHTTAWFAAYPELASAPGAYSIERHWGIFKPTLDPSREETYKFLEGFLGEMAALFPDPYFHIGGDEVEPTEWRESKSIQAFARDHKLADIAAIHQYFNHRVQQILHANGKIMIGWDEVLQPDLPQATVIQSWRGPESLAEAAQKGYRGILSAGYYLDHLRPASYHYSVDPLSGAAANLTPQQSKLILGGEACMWAELVDAETVDSRIWPRAAAIAERFWSPKETTDVDSMYARMEAVSRRLAWTGVQHRAVKDPMLDRLTGGHPEPSLHVLADASEALGLGPRRGGQYNTWTPLNKFVDAVPPESESVRRLELAARRLSAGDTALLRQRFTVWAANDARFQPLTEGNSFLAELKSLSKDLSALGAAGLQALDYLASHQTPPAGWITQQQAEFKRMLKPNAEVTLAAVRPVQILVEALAKP